MTGQIGDTEPGMPVGMMRANRVGSTLGPDRFIDGSWQSLARLRSAINTSRGGPAHSQFGGTGGGAGLVVTYIWSDRS